MLNRYSFTMSNLSRKLLATSLMPQNPSWGSTFPTEAPAATSLVSSMMSLAKSGRRPGSSVTSSIGL